ncbi:hypothetical protein [Pseudomonas luteola]|uniref:hypothetical protein n=1 Tax=Pseudomonas luteola TaxID=47886 RepID=UPI00123A4AE5|nr:MULTISPECIES: hypothetical protein [Pseudomonas]MBA1249895.1 hypothetical protein [Pseudomonas zeshuii]QEU28805.1 hypothetical protein FOB45_13865 [Pseudomonas luteola]
MLVDTRAITQRQPSREQLAKAIEAYLASGKQVTELGYCLPSARQYNIRTHFKLPGTPEFSAQ